MKKSLFIVLTIINMLTLIFGLTYIINADKVRLNDNTNNITNINNLYLTEGIVTDIDKNKDTVTVLTVDGELFTFKGVEDWLVDDGCVLSFDSKGTKDFKDDTIIDILYDNDIN